MTVSAADGRMLDVLVSGPPDGLALVFHDGTPEGLAAFGPMTDAASARGLRTVRYARPGYGLPHERQPGRVYVTAVAKLMNHRANSRLTPLPLRRRLGHPWPPDPARGA